MNHRWLLLVLCLLLVISAAIAVFHSMNGTSGVVFGGCDRVALAFIDQDDKQYISSYDSGKVSRQFSVPKGPASKWSLSGLVGYDAESKRWICTAWERSESHPLEIQRLVSVDSTGIVSPLPLEPCSKMYGIDKSQVFNGKLVVPAKNGSGISLHYYSIEGAAAGELRLNIPLTYALDDIDGIAFSSRGDIAVAMGAKRRSQPKMFVLDGKGDVLREIDDVYSPSFNDSGNRLALCSYGPSGMEGGDIVLFDLKSGESHILRASHSPVTRPFFLRGEKEHLCNARFAHGSDLLLLSYYQDDIMRGAFQILYAVDASTETQKWYRLPVYVEDGGWSPL